MLSSVARKVVRGVQTSKGGSRFVLTSGDKLPVNNHVLVSGGAMLKLLALLLLTATAIGDDAAG
jgi:hypothetical protein